MMPRFKIRVYRNKDERPAVERIIDSVRQLDLFIREAITGLDWVTISCSREDLQDENRCAMKLPKPLLEEDEMKMAEIIREVSLRTNASQKTVKEVISAWLEVVRESLRKDGKVMIRGLGTFSVQQRKGRRGRNPRTGEIIDIPPRKTVKFKPARDLL